MRRNAPERELTAYHEAGHAVAAHAFKRSPGPVSILPTATFSGIAFHAARALRVEAEPLRGSPQRMARSTMTPPGTQ